MFADTSYIHHSYFLIHYDSKLFLLINGIANDESLTESTSEIVMVAANCLTFGGNYAFITCGVCHGSVWMGFWHGSSTSDYDTTSAVMDMNNKRKMPTAFQKNRDHTAL